MKNELTKRLEEYQTKNKVTTKGALSVVLHVTRIASIEGLPLAHEGLRTREGGQVRGLSRSSIQAVLKDYGIRRILAREGGRTSRGSIGAMERYVAFLNELHAIELIDLKAVEKWWVERVKDFFASQPFILRHDLNRSFKAMLYDLFEQAKKRQKENPGTTYMGSVLQHLVGAKLELVLKDRSIQITHHGASVADAPTERAGDFVLEDVAIHVTTAPTQALIQKCQENINEGYRVIIVTTQERVPMAEGNAEIEGVVERIDILAAEQFLATNLHELSFFKNSERRATIDLLIKEYNRIVDACETDPSLHIRLGK